jgi:hypothetical protein
VEVGEDVADGEDAVGEGMATIEEDGEATGIIMRPTRSDDKYMEKKLVRSWVLKVSF